MFPDKNEIDSYLSQFGQIDIREESSSDRGASELIDSGDNGGKDVESSSQKDMTTAKPFESLTVDDTSNAVGGVFSNGNGKNKMDTFPSSTIIAKEMTDINKNYFGSYSSFGIHREMISDKVPPNLKFV